MTEVILVLVLPFIILLALGVPIAFALGISSCIFLFLSNTPIPHLVVVTEMYSGIDSFALLALPLFVFAGELLSRAKITQQLVDISNVMVGWLKGGLAQVTVVSAMLISGITGSAFADAASIGGLLIPAMVKQKYPPAFAAALTAASTVNGPIIPPSIPMIIVGGILGISIGGLFAGGMIPGILLGLSLMVVNYIISRKKGYGTYYKFPGIRGVITVLIRGIPALLAPFFLLGGIISGIFTPTEAGAVAVLYCLVVGVVVYKTIGFHGLVDAMIVSVKVTASALFIVATAILFSRILAYYKAPQSVLQVLLGITSNKILILLLINGFLLVMGMLMDAIANLVILGPLLMPVCVLGLGMHPLHFGIMLILNLCIGLITPPFSMLLFITTPIAKAQYEKVIREVLPFMMAEYIVLIIIIYVPEVSLFIPRLFGFGL